MEFDYTFSNVPSLLFRQLSMRRRSIETKMFIVLSRDISHVLLNRPNARIIVRILHQFVSGIFDITQPA
jgi:hypothetical protein